MSNWREMIERPEMQAMSESHRAWQQQLQQAEMQAQAAAEAQAQRADEPVSVPFGCASLLPVWRNPDGSPVASERSRMRFDLWQEGAPGQVQMSDPPQSEKPATDTSAGAVQRRIDDVCQDLVAGRTTPAQQRGLGGAVERAGRIPAGSDAAVGRIARLPW